MLFVAADPQGVRRLYTRRVDELALHRPEWTETPSAAFFSPDGAFVGFWAAGRLQKVGLAGGAPQVVAESAPPAGATWTAGGDIVFSPAGSPTLQRVPATGGAPAPAAPLDSANGETIQLSPLALPDEKHVLYMSWESCCLEDVRIGLLDLATGRSRRLALDDTTGLGFVDGRLTYADRAGAILANEQNGACVNSDSPKDVGPGEMCVGNPINPGTGNKYQVETDYSGFGASRSASSAITTARTSSEAPISDRTGAARLTVQS